MSKRKAISAALAKSSGSARSASPEPTDVLQQPEEPCRDPHYRPGRARKTNITGYFPPEVKRQLRLLAAERDTTMQDLLAEALNALFASHGKPEIAPVERSPR